MKKIFSFMLLLLAVGTSTSLVSCSDDDSVSQSTDRQFMTMFITDNTRGKGGDYPYNCGVDGAYPHGNTIHLYWYGVRDCAGYQIQMSTTSKVSTGASAWAAIQGTSDLLLDTIVGPDVLDLRVYDLLYSTDYRFAIRALSKEDSNIKGDESTFAHASNWYGSMVMVVSGKNIWVSRHGTATPLHLPCMSTRLRQLRQICTST